MDLQSSTTESDYVRIDADLLIPGRGPPLKDATCILQSRSIAHVGLRSSLPDEYTSLPTIHVPTLLPGLWDAHTHYYGARGLSIDAFYSTQPALAGARTARDLAATLNAGFTSVRELGGWGHQIAEAVTEGSIVGPRIYSAVSPISMTARHGDAHGIPLPALRDAIEHGLPLHLCDGVPECIKAVRQQLRRGASLIKVCASGGCASQLDDPEHQQFNDGELQAMVEEAARSDRIVAAHCHGKAGILAALKAGCKTIEHGTYMDEKCMHLMREKGAMLIATRTFFEASLKVRELWSPESYAKLEGAAATHKEAYAMAVRSGIRIALGTDLGLGGVVSDSPAGKVFSHGSNGKELVYAVEASMSPMEAIEAATANAAETLGPKMAPKSGQVKLDWDADLIAVKGNPLMDIGILAEAENVSHVWRVGRLYKAPQMKSRAV
ncbi:MAG: hypothetical protein ASARMPRED_001470 [Alectoria sarmentosa]|nr:MAG: hypothetical protein ASARMPRED_001470 [Alectoria sarmentosa]